MYDVCMCVCVCIYICENVNLQHRHGHVTSLGAERDFDLWQAFSIISALAYLLCQASP